MNSFRRLTLSVLFVVTALCIRSSDSRAQETADQLQQLVAPIALYPDPLLAEVLAASTYPDQVDAAENWLTQNASLTTDQVADAVGRMDWDDSVKSLTEFPTVLSNMAQNLSWTSALGDAYYNQPDDVMDAVQTLRQRAVQAGTLQSNAQIHLSNENGLIVIESVSSDIVSIPDYDCWVVYGSPIIPWPNYVFAPRIVRGPGIFWNVSVHIGGAWTHVNWGWRNWKFDWHERRVVFNRRPYVSHSLTVINRRLVSRPRGPEVRGPETGRLVQRPEEKPGNPPAMIRRGTEPAKPFRNPGGEPPRPLATPREPVDSKSARGFPAPKSPSSPAGTHTGAFNGIDRGGIASRNSQRGQASMQPHQAPARPAASASHVAQGPRGGSPPRSAQSNRGGRGR